MKTKTATTKTPQWNTKNNGIPRGRRKDEDTKEEGARAFVIAPVVSLSLYFPCTVSRVPFTVH
jgi:hypothetical protein